MREAAETKARRLLADGWVTIHHAGPWYVSASVQGDTGLYVAGYEQGSWFCTCPCPAACSHVMALKLVADPAQSIRAVAS